MRRIALFSIVLACIAASCCLTVSAEHPSLSVALPLDTVSPSCASLAEETTSSPSQWTLLKEDTGTERSYSDSWSAGDMAGVVLHPDAVHLPIYVASIACELTVLPGQTNAQGEVTLQAHLYSVENSEGVLQPGALLASSHEHVANVENQGGMTWFTHTLDTEVMLTQDTPVLAVIEFKSGTEGETPSLITDNQFDVGDEACFFWRDGAWRTQSTFWSDPANVGLVMIRANGRLASGPTHRTLQTVPALQDTLITQGQPTQTLPELNYLLAGDYSQGTFGAVRSLVAFDDLEPPSPEATISRATLMLSNHRSVTESVDGELAVYAATRSWSEGNATWNSDASNFGELLASRTIIGRERRDDPQVPHDKLNGWLTFDLTAQAQAWADAPEENHGVMLRGDEGTLNSGRYLRSSEYTVYPSYRPQIVVEWSWPDTDFYTRALVPLVTR